MLVPAPLGNQYGLALKDPEMRQRAYKSFCDHLSEGYSQDCWYFEEGDNLCCYKTMLSYIENNPTEFPAIQRDIAKTKGKKYYEGLCKASANGENTKANTASLQMIMRNKYGWDKPEKTDGEKQVIVETTTYRKTNSKE